MNTRLGKSFGLAFVVAVGILALMFALGTFSAQKAGAQAADPVLALDTTRADSNVAVTLTLAVPNLQPGATIAITLENLVTTTSPPTVTVEDARTWPVADAADERNVAMDAFNTNVALSGASQSQIDDVSPTYGTLTLTLIGDTDTAAPEADHDGDAGTPVIQQGIKAGTITINVAATAEIKTSQTIETVKASVVIDADGTVGAAGTAAPDSNEVDTGVVLDADPQTPGSNSYITVEVASADGTGVDGGTIDVDSRIILDMGSFQLPTTINRNDVSITGLDASGGQIQAGTPKEVIVSGKKVTLYVPDMNTANLTLDKLSPHYRIAFRQAAGIKIRATEGSSSVTADEPGEGTASNTIMFARVARLSAAKGKNGSSLTISGNGWNKPVSAVFIDHPISRRCRN